MQAKRKRGRPSVQNATDKSDLLKTARQEFALRGYEGVSMTGLAKAAGISDALLYYHFKNKETLWKEAVTDSTRQLATQIEEVQKLFKDLKGISVLKVLTRQFTYFTANNVEFTKIVFQEMINRSERAKWLVESLMMPIHNAVVTILEEAQRNGEIKKFPIPNFTSAIIGAITSYFIHAYKLELLYDLNPLEEDAIEQHIDTINEIFFSNILDE